MKKAPQPRDVRVGINGLELHYIDWGNHRCPPILLLHGFLSHANTWRNLAARICADYRVMALDQRGHGTSDWSADSAYSIDDHFLDLAAFIDYLSLTELVIIGHSMGGRNALFYTACCPESVKALILVDARPGNTDESMDALKRLLNGYRKGSSRHNDDDRAEKIREQTRRRKKPDIPAESKRLPSYDPDLIVGAERAGYRVESLWPYMASLKCPTLVVRGEKSAFISKAEAQTMIEMIPRAELAEIKGASHLPMFQNPSAFKSAVDSFLAELR